MNERERWVNERVRNREMNERKKEIERERDILAEDVLCRIGSQKSVDRLFLND